ncbi:MAG: hypothetical protein CEO22_471 [Candidatus Berkelbacteria bacterium Gr01-1014_85]|uniref:Uncharacterized protein n=1 Tax=Candidatus Berkelbacteria bacterium Gr01-1014_85 TaxID=2017150 RepID=A0A554JAU7_9BACT|nr:MAG: hypothetical protein CEO22_471 [Candidatus Berkelbacteria bacterium Gr01-1014_85]
MKLSDLPAELQQLIAEYKRLHQSANDVWKDAGGGIERTDRFIRLSDRLMKEAEGVKEQIKAYCARHGLKFSEVEAHLK